MVPVIALKLLRSRAAWSAAAVLAVVAVIWYQHGRIDDLLDVRAKLEADLASAVGANATNQQTIAKLSLANEEFRDLLESTQHDSQMAIEQAERDRDRIRSELLKSQGSLREALSSTPDCEELAKLDIGAICPLAAQRLRR